MHLEIRNTLPRKVLSHIATSMVPLAVYALAALLPVDQSITRALSAYSFPLFGALLLLHYLSYRIAAPYRWLASASLTMALLGLSLSFLWHSGYSDDKIIGGLLPFRDGLDYFNGADWILGGQSIRTLNEGAAWRPLYPGFLATLLWTTGGNLQWALAIQVGLAGWCFSLAAIQMRNRLGAAAAALFVTLLYFFIQPLIGTAYTETLGLALGCLGFVLLWEAAEAKRAWELVLGLIVLMLAVSARAGAFLIFPVLVLWAGWAWRGGQRFSGRVAGIALATVVAAYLTVNTIYTRLVVEPGGFPFGNLAFTVYGQVNGGAGYHKAFEDLGARNPEVILRAAWRFFLAHPQGFVVGTAKAFRDFLSPLWGVFGLGFGVQDLALSIAGMVLMLVGLYRAGRGRAEPNSSLLLAGFIGVLLSVPFLPPIDGGIRIYASTMPFVYALPAAALGGMRAVSRVEQAHRSVATAARVVSLWLGAMTVLVPVLIRYATMQVHIAAPNCPAEQVAFATTLRAGRHIDLVPEGTAACGTLPGVCLEQFKSFGAANDPSDAAVFADLAAVAEASVARVFVGNDLLGGRPHVFIGAASALDVGDKAVIGGCATETQIKGRPSTYEIRSVSSGSAAQ
ncbi:MAG: hypothetical protein V1755_13075 [Chloroflexota bacterium]